MNDLALKHCDFISAISMIHHFGTELAEEKIPYASTLLQESLGEGSPNA